MLGIKVAQYFLKVAKNVAIEAFDKSMTTKGKMTYQTEQPLVSVPWTN